MSEIPNPNYEEQPKNDAFHYRECLNNVGEYIDKISDLVASSAIPPLGIKNLIQADLKVTHVSEFGPEFYTEKIDLSLHEQDSIHEVWDIKITGSRNSEPKYLWGSLIKSPDNLVLLVGHQEHEDIRPPMNSLKPATFEQLIELEYIIWSLQVDAVVATDGYDSFASSSPYDKNAKQEFKTHLLNFKIGNLTVPGLIKEGKLLKPSKYPDLDNRE